MRARSRGAGCMAMIYATLAVSFLLLLGGSPGSLAASAASDSASNCSAANITLRSCYVNRDLLQLRYHADTPTAPESLQYVFTTTENLKLTYGVARSEEIKDPHLNSVGNREYLLTFITSHEIASAHLSDPACQAEYLSSSITCDYASGGVFSDAASVCGGQPSIPARTRCRLYLHESPSVDLPEECRIQGSAGRLSCILLRKQMLPCLAQNGSDALSCARRVIGLGDLAQEKVVCASLAGAQKDTCMATLAEKVFRLVQFKFLVLQHRAASLLTRGATEELIVDFISNVEVRNQAFSSVATIAEKQNIVRQVQHLWEDFLYNTAPQVMQQGGGQP